MNSLLDWVVQQNSADNAVRRNAEWRFGEEARQNPSTVVFHLLQAAENDSLSEHIRQSCLLHMRRMVPQFWSMGFSSFIGPPIEQDVKALVREKMLGLATESSSSKLRKGSAYVIVQIAAADFPDEWPSLLSDLYARAMAFSNEVCVMGSLDVLTELFDDLIGEDQFWEGGVGNQLISYITHMLGSEMSAMAKTSGLKLYLTVFNTLSSAEALESDERRRSVLSHVVFLSELLLKLLVGPDSASIELRSYIYRVFARLLSNFSRHVTRDVKTALLDAMAQDLLRTSALLPASDETLTAHVSDLFDTLSLLQHHLPLSELPADVFSAVISCLVSCSVYPADTAEDYTADFNVFVTDVSGLSTKTTTRESVHDFLADLNPKDAVSFFSHLQSASYTEMDWSSAEAHLFILEGLCENEEADFSGFSAASLLESLSALKRRLPNSLVYARYTMFLPRFMEKFSKSVAVNTVGVTTFKDVIDNVFSLSGEDHQLVKASTLVSTTIWQNVPGYDVKLLGAETQRKIIELVCHLLDDSEDDTLPVLLEAISVAIDIDHENSLSVQVDNHTICEIILLVSFKDPANVQLTIDSAECVSNMLAHLSPTQYLRICEKCVPYLLNVIKSNSGVGGMVEYNPALFLALELLGCVVGAAPASSENEALPQELFLYAFPVLQNLIMATSDDQILQNAGEVFNNFLQNGSKWFVDYTDPNSGEKGLDILLHISSKFLAPELSDSAAMNCGLIVITLFEKFSSVLDQNFFYQLLQATVKRLVLAKEVITIENLVMVFCKLVLNTSPETVIDALTGMELEEHGGQNGLAAVMPIWFSSFEVTRGFEKIKQNILALGKIFSLGDARVSDLTVDGEPIPYSGDKIITRSMSKSMPQKYTQIKAPHKILKLLVSELEFQCSQPDPEDFVAGEDNGDDDGWEDMGDIGVPTFDKLQSYVDSDEEDDNQVSDEGIKDMVVQFFKECISKNMGGFQTYYELLSDEEKTVISENVIFD